MKISNFTSALSLAVVGVSYPIVAAAQQASRPNIILIMTDQQRGDCVGAMGNRYISTPNMDALAHDGVLFSNGYSSTPSSTPARAGLLTGMSPWAHGMLGYAKVAQRYQYEMPRMLRDSGYYTFGIGKMHYTPQRNLHGFHGALLDESGRVYSEDFVSDYRQWFIAQAPGANPDATGIGWNDHQGRVYQPAQELHPTLWTADRAIEFIGNYEMESPLFLKISFARPHSPYDPPQQYYDMYRDKPVEEPSVGGWAARFADRKERPDAAFGDFGRDHAIESRRFYYGAITYIDDQIGRIIEALKESGMYDNSLIVFISDHGDMLGDHHHWRKTYAYEGSSHVPFIVKPPANSNYAVSGQVREQVVEIRDVLPTFLQAAGIPQPEAMDGRSVISVIKDAKAPWRKYIDLEHALFYDDNDNYWAALTDGRMKYIRFFRSGTEQLFDLSCDRGEVNDLSGDKKFRKELEKWRAAMTDHLSVRGAPYVVDGALATFQKVILLGPNYPKTESK